MNINELVDSVKWKATNYVVPHEYILFRDYPEECAQLSKALTKSTFFDVYRGVKYKNLYIGEWKYWKTGAVINRRKAKLALHYVMATLCGTCKLLSGGEIKPFHQEHPDAVYVVRGTECGDLINPREGETFKTYWCNKVQPSELMFIQPAIGECCRFYSGKNGTANKRSV